MYCCIMLVCFSVVIFLEVDSSFGMAQNYFLALEIVVKWTHMHSLKKA